MSQVKDTPVALNETELKEYGLSIETDVMDRYLRVKKKDQDSFEEGTIMMFPTQSQGVFTKSGKTIGDDSWGINEYLFDKAWFTENSAKIWVAENEMNLKVKVPKEKEVIEEVEEKEEEKVEDDKEEEKEFAELQEVRGVEIFATGNHNGDKYTMGDLEEMVNNFTALKDKLKPYVKLGHNKDQKLLKADGLPSAGWIDKIYVQGDKLLADIVDMPKKIYNLIKNKAYKRISSEIYWNLKEQGKTFKRALKAIALLGGDTPAVGSLADIEALYTKVYLQELDFEDCKSHDYTESEELNMDIDYKAKCEEFEKKNEELETKYSELQTKIKQTEIEAIVDDFISKKKIKPAQRDLMISVYNKLSGVKEYSLNSEDDSLTKLFELNEDQVNTEETSEEGKEEEKVDDAKVSENILKAKSYNEALNEYVKEEK